MPVLKNARHERFAQEIAKGAAGSSAYKTAGYTADGNAAEAAASRLLRDVKVSARIEELTGRAAAKVEATIERWTEEVAGLAHSDIRDVLEFGPGYVRVKEGATLTAAQAALISEVSMTKDGQRLKLHSKLDALEKLAKRFGWYAPEQHQHTVQVTKIETVIVDPQNRNP